MDARACPGMRCALMRTSAARHAPRLPGVLYTRALTPGSGETAKVQVAIVSVYRCRRHTHTHCTDRRPTGICRN
eukprot:10635429-Alexandrium_andersonii.AAC.1